MDAKTAREKVLARKKLTGTALRKLRKYFGYSVDDLCEATGIRFRTIQSWEAGYREPREEGWIRLRRAFVDLAMQEGRERKDAIGFIDERLFPKPIVR